MSEDDRYAYVEGTVVKETRHKVGRAEYRRLHLDHEDSFPVSKYDVPVEVGDRVLLQHREFDIFWDIVEVTPRGMYNAIPH